jgi:uncharacterized membrane protein
MNGAHLHLLINHFPIILPILGCIILLIGLIVKKDVVKIIALSFFIFTTLFTFAANLTGEGAEEVIENIKEVDEKFIEIHEETAEGFSIGSYILGTLSLISLWSLYSQKNYAKYLVYINLLVGLAILVAATRVGNTGGEIRHTEIRNDFNSNAKPQIKQENDMNKH